MNYVEEARRILLDNYPDKVEGDEDNRLIDLYTLLVLTKGRHTTLEDVHEAWGVWRTRTAPGHESIVPFDELTPEIQAYDEPYAEAIRAAAVRSNP